MTTSKATARPLYAHGMAVMTAEHYTFVTARNRDEANEIVKAVNSHDVMLEALKLALKYKVCDEGSTTFAIRAAIAIAEKE